MQLKPDQLATSLAKGVQRLYTIHGDEPLLAQEAADAIRDSARRAGYTERSVHVVSGAHYDWGTVLGAAQELSLFAQRQLIEIRIPSGKPGKEGSAALQRYCELLSDDVTTIVQLPRLDGTQLKSAWFLALDAAGVCIRVEPIDRRALPAWLAQRLAQRQQRVADAEEGERTLAFLADRVEGNLLAAHQELSKLALLHPPGVLSYEQVHAAVLNVARYDIGKLSEAVLAGQVTRALRVLEGLQGEGESAVYVHWTLAEDLRALERVRAAVASGKPLPMALREQRVWGVKERQFERVLPRLADHTLAHLVTAASIADGIVKGLPHPDWPTDAWGALRHLVLLSLDAMGATDVGPGSRRVDAGSRASAKPVSRLALRITR
jgi:DNA polymerase III subunit delta